MDRAWLTVIGLVCDIAGAIILGWSVFVTPANAERLSGEYIEVNPYQRADRLKQSRYAKIGLSVLVLGFLLQLIGSWP